MMKSEQFRAALECAVKDFRWPPGRYPDIEWIMDAEEGSPYEWNYQIGLEHTQLGGINQCAWYVTWLEAWKAGNEELQEEALAYMTDVIPNFEELVSGYPSDGRSGGTIQRDKEIAAAAALGDPSKVQYHLDVTCASIPFILHPPTPLSNDVTQTQLASHSAKRPSRVKADA